MLSSLSVEALLGGCGQVVLLNPKGPIGGGERNLIFLALGLMIIVVIPVVFMALWFPRKYSASNKKATYAPKWSSSLKLEVVVWLVPIGITTVLGYLAWTNTLSLDPYKPVDQGVKPVNIEAVSLNWKWLFIYPGYNIARSMNLFSPRCAAELQDHFGHRNELVFIPQLGSQMYSMAGMQTSCISWPINPVSIRARASNSAATVSLYAFPGDAVSRNEFVAWVEKVEDRPEARLGAVRRCSEEPSLGYPVTYFPQSSPGYSTDHKSIHSRPLRQSGPAFHACSKSSSRVGWICSES